MQVKIDNKAVIFQVKHIMYVGCYFILALCRCYSWNISYPTEKFSLNHTLITLQLICHSEECVRYLCLICDLRHFKVTIFAHFGTPRFA